MILKGGYKDVQMSVALHKYLLIVLNFQTKAGCFSPNISIIGEFQLFGIDWVLCFTIGAAAEMKAHCCMILNIDECHWLDLDIVTQPEICVIMFSDGRLYYRKVADNTSTFQAVETDVTSATLKGLLDALWKWANLMILDFRLGSQLAVCSVHHGHHHRQQL